MSDQLDNLETMVTAMLAKEVRPTEDRVRELITQMRDLPFLTGITDADCENLARRIEERHGISMGLGAGVASKDFEPWLADAKIRGEIDGYYWNRYRRLLVEKKMPPDVVSGMDEVTDRILGYLGNPRDDGEWSRRGMVVGYVQSGKTANYTGLVCKAADAGYRLIVVIAGIHNNLRNQTQSRIDEGFIGRDTARLARKDRAEAQKIIGVGRFDQTRFPVSLTTSLRDFNKATATTNTSQIGQYSVPVVLVIKKNASTLKNLVEWLKEHSAGAASEMVEQPMLLIDDEADNASINIKHGKDEVARINGQIRELLGLFRRSCYVGYTATPFANIFIDPDTDHDTFRQDLFPRHFIIGLDAPSNYFGAQKVFIDNRDEHIRDIDDNEDILPLKHKIDHSLDGLPASLEKAMRAFIVARAIRNLRGQQGDHASMLVNASRFTGIQGQLRRRISDFVERIRSAVTVDGGKGTAALQNAQIAALRQVWSEEFAELDGADRWEPIQSSLHDVLAASRIVEVNASRQASSLDYDRKGDFGQTVIAIGGFSLSRGLTLEGLTVSYFLRNSMMYDTLMQMGRWFGYRPDYEDLCRVWMPAESVGWYAHIAEAMDELQRDLKRMELDGGTPEDFGLAVRSHPQNLIVTARNKMGSGQEVPMKVGLANRLIETTRLSADPTIIERNVAAARRLVEISHKPGTAESVVTRESSPFGTLASGVPVEHVLEFLRAFRPHGSNPATDPRLIGDYISDRAATELELWDILIASAKGNDNQDDLIGPALGTYSRTVAKRDVDSGFFDIGSGSARVGQPGDEKAGLDDTTIQDAEVEFRMKEPKKTFPDHIYRSARSRPLLIVRVLAPRIQNDARSLPLVPAWSISFPPSSIEGGTVEYVVGKVMLRELFGDADEVDEDAEYA